MELRITDAETCQKLKELKDLECLKTNTSAIRFLLTRFFEEEELIRNINLDNKTKKYQLKSRQFNI